MSVVRCGDLERSYVELGERAARAATGLAALGVVPGERVAIVLRNEPAFLELTAAARMLGAVPVPVNWHWRGAELSLLLRDCEPRVIAVHADLAEVVAGAAPPGVRIVEVAVPPSLGGDGSVSGEHLDYEAWLATCPPRSEPPVPAPMSMIYTSGTTGQAKGILRHRTTPEQDKAIGGLVLEGLALAPGQRTLVPAPLYHTAPNTHALFAMALGNELTIMPRFDAEELLRLVERFSIEHVQMVPTMFSRLLALPPAVRSAYDLSSLRSVVHAAAPCPPEVKRAMIEWLGPIVHEYYGGSEVGIAVRCDADEWLAHPGTVGRPVLDAAVRILDEDGADVPVGEVGEVYLRPPSVWPDFTYAGQPEARAAMERDGYLTLGDAGRVDEDGFLYLTDRVKDMVISGGVNIYPAEIEQCLMSLPGVRDAAVVGIPDADLGEALAAHVDADPAAGLTEDDVRDWVGTRLARYKTPRVVVFDANLPREDSGKLFKRRIRDRYWATARQI